MLPLNKINMENEIKNIENFLNTLPKTGGFKVPEDYFEKLNIKVIENVNSKKTIGVKLHWVNSINLTAISASLFIISGLFLFEPNSNKNQEPNVEEIIIHLQQEEITVDLLCDAGWCLELDQTEYKNTDLEEKIFLEIESDLIITEL